MLYLITGSNGAGKTLNTLKWVRERQLKEHRPVAYNGRFELVEDGPLADWKKIDFKDWQDEPDGTIFVIDEAHNDLPLRGPRGDQPAYVSQLAEHRKRGMDFYLITQHPANIDTFVRRLIGPPGWHRHLKRVFGSQMVSYAEYTAANLNCEKAGASKDGERKTVGFPKEVFGWYKSTTLDTTQRTIPKAVLYLAGLAIAVPALFWWGFRSVGETIKKGPTLAASAAGPAASAPAAPPRGAPAAERVAMTAEQYLEHRAPRVREFVHTAPAYDAVTQPTRAPYPAACVSMKTKGCKCYSQQGTLLPSVTFDVCIQIVQNGFFVDWDNERGERQREGPVVASAQSPVIEAEPLPGPTSSSRQATAVTDVAASYRAAGGRVDRAPL